MGPHGYSAPIHDYLACIRLVLTTLAICLLSSKKKLQRLQSATLPNQQTISSTICAAQTEVIFGLLRSWVKQLDVSILFDGQLVRGSTALLMRVILGLHQLTSSSSWRILWIAESLPKQILNFTTY